MLSITKLGIEALSRFAKQQEFLYKENCPCIYRGNYRRNGVPFKWAKVITDDTIPAKGHWCCDCTSQVSYLIYTWSWEHGIKKIPFSKNDTLRQIIEKLLSAGPMFSHIAIMEKHSKTRILWVYRFEKEKV